MPHLQDRRGLTLLCDRASDLPPGRAGWQKVGFGGLLRAIPCAIVSGVAGNTPHRFKHPARGPCGLEKTTSSCGRGRAVRILLVEDEKKVASFIKRGLAEVGYAVDVASDGETGLMMGLDRVHDLIILDINLPSKDGLNILHELRRKKIATPVLILTVRATIEDKVIGLDTGADDYLTKPFAFEELLARVRALLRRQADVEAPLLKVADLTLDPARRLVFRGGEKIDLTTKEFALLDYFMRNPDRVLTRTMISEHVWDYDFDPMTNVIDVYVNYLRNKIDSGRQAKLIRTIRGVGYVLKVK